MSRSNQTAFRRTRPALESLERRTLPSATPLPLVSGYAPLSLERVDRAMQAVGVQLTAPTPSASPSVALQGQITIDLDQDGVLDTIALSLAPGGGGDTLDVFYGGSALRPPMEREMSLDFVARRLILGDFDGDGRLDFFAQEGSSATGMLLLGRPDGTFAACRQSPGLTSLAAAALQAPGVLDFVAGRVPTTPAATPVVPSAPGVQETVEAGALPPLQVQLADVDGDGKPDLVVSTGDGSLEAFAGLGNGRFASQPWALPDLFAGTGPVYAAFAELGAGGTGGPVIEMALASPSLGEVAVFEGRGGSFLQGQVMWVGRSPSSVSLQDVTGDGTLDLIVTCAGSNSLWIFRGQGDGRFDASRPLILATGADPTAAFVGHFDASGRAEIVVLDRGSNALTFYSNTTGTLDRSVQLSSGGVGPTAGVVRDVNGDGYDDLIVANQDSGQVTLFYGGAEGLREAQTIDRPGTHPAALVVGPGLASSFDVYVLDEGSGEAQILTFAVPAPEATAVDDIAPPKLDPTPEVRIFFQTLSAETVEAVPVLLVGHSEDEGTSLGGGQVPPKAATATPTPVKPGKSGGAVTGSIAQGEADPTPSPGEIAAQRYLLDIEDAPAPELEAESASPPSLKEGRAQAEREAKAAESAAPGMRAGRPTPREEARAGEGGEVPVARETEAATIGELLLGVLLVSGLPGEWAGRSRLNGPPGRAADRRTAR